MPGKSIPIINLGGEISKKEFCALNPQEKCTSCYTFGKRINPLIGKDY